MDTKLEESIKRAIEKSKRLQRDNEILSAKVDTMELFRQALNSNPMQIGGYAQERDPFHELELCFVHAKMMEKIAKPSGVGSTGVRMTSSNPLENDNSTD